MRVARLAPSRFRPLRPALAVLLLACGCGGDATAPGSGALDGDWALPVGDVIDEFHVQERDGLLAGTYLVGGILAPPSRFLFTGTVRLRQIVLQWSEDGHQYVAHATLAPDSKSFSGTVTVNGDSSRSFGPYLHFPQ